MESEDSLYVLSVIHAREKYDVSQSGSMVVYDQDPLFLFRYLPVIICAKDLTHLFHDLNHSFFTAKPVSMPMTTYMYSENIIMMFGASLADNIR